MLHELGQNSSCNLLFLTKENQYERKNRILSKSLNLMAMFFNTIIILFISHDLFIQFELTRLLSYFCIHAYCYY